MNTGKQNKREETHQKSHPIICTSSISRYLLLVIIVILGGFIIAMGTYSGTFHFWKYPVCDLGTLYTVGQQQFNIKSLLFFDLAMLISGFLMIQVGRSFTSDIPFQHKKIKQILSFTCGLGFILMMIPYTFHIMVHITGATLVIMSLWILATLFSFEIKPYIYPINFFISQLLLHGSIVSYGILYVLQMSGNDAAQKIGIICLMIVFGFITRYRPRNNVSTKDYQQSPGTA